jgi:hypothetical protein
MLSVLHIYQEETHKQETVKHNSNLTGTGMVGGCTPRLNGVFNTRSQALKVCHGFELSVATRSSRATVVIKTRNGGADSGLYEGYVAIALICES